MAQTFLDLLGSNLALVNQLRTASAGSPLRPGGAVSPDTTTQGGGGIPLPPSGGGGGTVGPGAGGGVGPDVYDRYAAGTATPADLNALVRNGDITLNEAHTYTAGQNKQPPSNPTGGLYPYNPQTGQVSAYPGSSERGSLAVEGGGPVNTYADPQTGVLYNSSGQALPQYLQKYLGGAGGPGGDPYAGAANARAEAALQEQIRQNRIGEAQAAITNMLNRQKLTADTAPWMLPAGTTNFPGFGPNDKAVRLGLVGAQPVTPIAFNPNASGAPDQIANDLATLRRAAGIG